MAKKILRFVLYTLGVLVLGLACWGLAIVYRWPAWVGVLLFVILVGLLLGFGFLRRLVYRIRHRVQDALAQRRAPEQPVRKPGEDLNTLWRQGLALLRRSSLSREGNPVYLLPWYLMLGATGSGKTTALTRARLASPLKAVRQSAVLDETRSIDWWYFDRSVVIDTSGRYLTAPPESAPGQEWKRLLTLLLRSRQRESLNGVVVTVAADKLLFGSSDVLNEEGRAIRTRLDQLMRVMDSRFPVYVLVTKCDGLYGMDEWADRLPAKALAQALGFAAGAPRLSPGEFLDQAFQSVADRLKDLRLVLTERLEVVGAGLLLFPNEFERLRPGLEEFFTSAFGANPYLETPFLRGMFFCSGQQRGGASSHVLKDTDLPEQTLVLSGATRGLFLHDIFARVLPADRHVNAPLGTRRHWRQVTSGVGLAAWLLLAAAAAVVLTASFGQVLSTVATLKEESVASRLTITGHLADDAGVLTRYYRSEQWLAERNGRWFSRLLPLGGNALGLEQTLRQRYAEAFGRFLASDVDAGIGERVRLLQQRPADAAQARLITFLTRRINLLQARLDGADAGALARLPRAWNSGTELGLALGEVTSAEAPGEIYLAYLAWAGGPEALRGERARLQTWLTQLTEANAELSWLTPWASTQPEFRPVILSEFWAGSRPVMTGAPQVDAAYTEAGRGAVLAFLKEFESAAPGGFVSARRGAFDAWYRAQRLESWRLLLVGLDQGRETLGGESQWKALAPRIATDRGPYLLALERAGQELGTEADEGTPAWLRGLRTFNVVRGLAQKEDFLGSARQAAGIANNAGSQIIRGSIERGPDRGRAIYEDHQVAVKAYHQFQAQIAKAANDAVGGSGKALKVAGDFHGFAADPVLKDEPLHAAADALAELRRRLGDAPGELDALGAVLGGPMDFLVRYAQRQASCELQAEWAAKVVYPTQGVASEAELNEQLYGAKGAVWTFADGMAKPFLQRDARAYRVVQTMGWVLPFTPEFLHFINVAVDRRLEHTVKSQRSDIAEKRAQVQGQKRQAEIQRRQQEAQRRLRDVEKAADELHRAADALDHAATPIGLAAQPTNVNSGAKAYPQSTVLAVQCASALTTLVNYNYPVSQALNWSPASCGDTTLEIRFDGFTAQRKYPGALGVVAFLRDFAGGRRNFRAEEFPEVRARLEAAGVREISVRYEVSGADAVLRQADQLGDLRRREAERRQDKAVVQEQLDRLEQMSTQDKQTSAQDQDEVLERQEAALTKGVGVNLPQRIGQCWDAAPVPAARVPESTAVRPVPAPTPPVAAPVKPAAPARVPNRAAADAAAVAMAGEGGTLMSVHWRLPSVVAPVPAQRDSSGTDLARLGAEQDAFQAQRLQQDRELAAAVLEQTGVPADFGR